MRERLHEYLRARPDGVAADELIGLVFSGAGQDAGFAPRFLHALLDRDERFHFDTAARVWRIEDQQVVTQPLAETTFVVVDLETTGDAPGVGAITEIGAVRVSGGRLVGEFQTLVNPGRPIQPFVIGLTGITDAMVATAPRIAEALPRFLEFAGDAVLVAHNVTFDLGHLDAVHRRLFGRPLERTAICTLKLARQLLPDLKQRNLGAVAAALGLGDADRHRALGDARITAEALCIFLERAAADGVATLDQLAELQRRASDGKPFIMRVPRERLNEVPERPGVYHWLGDDGRLLYVGRARRLRHRLASYWSNTRSHGAKTLDLIRKVHDFRIIETGSELAAALLEARQIHDLKPPFNRQRRHLPRVGYLKLSAQNPFPRLWVTERLTADKATYFGPFASIEDAEQVHATLTRRFKLRTCTENLAPDPGIVPCLLGQVGDCSAPCAARVAAIEYGAQVDALLDAVRGQDLRDLLPPRHRALQWTVTQQNFVVLLPTAERDAAQFYGVLGGRLAVEARITAAGDLVAAASLVSERFARYQDVPLARDDVAAATILAAWLRDHRQEGLLLPLDTPAAIFDRLDELSVTVTDLRQHGPLPVIDGLHE